MLLSKHFVFIHVQKTGGTTVRSILEKHAPEEWELTDFGQHPTYADIPPSHAHLPKFAFVRNPYSWYVSWYHFQRNRERSDIYLEVSENDTLGFADTMRRMFKIRPELKHGSGPLLQYLWKALGPGLEGIKAGKMENMRDDLARILGECCEMPTAMEAAIASLPVLNASPHDHYSNYYDEELRDLIYEKDKPIFQHFDYSFESPPN